MIDRPLRRWQVQALERWHASGKRGIVSVVTGGGKTYFALNCIRDFQRVTPGATVVISVPTEALVAQWLEELITFFDMPLGYANVVSGRSPIKRGRLNIGVINTVSKSVETCTAADILLVIDECHKAASPSFRKVLDLETSATLGLSATPERPYDSWFEEILVPALGPIIYQYDLTEALADSVIVPFKLINVLFSLSDDDKEKYDKLTASIGAAISRFGVESDEVVRMLLKRARFVNSIPSRIGLALKIIAREHQRKILVFHEDIASCEIIAKSLIEVGMKAECYHSRLTIAQRVEALRKYRSAELGVLVSCRALDEGFNVPETEIGIIAASTATSRQRIQRMGRVLRPADGKQSAVIYSIVTSDPEVKRLMAECESLQEVADIEWVKA